MDKKNTYKSYEEWEDIKYYQDIRQAALGIGFIIAGVLALIVGKFFNIEQDIKLPIFAILSGFLLIFVKISPTKKDYIQYLKSHKELNDQDESYNKEIYFLKNN